jgi:hypothetical protein
MGYREERDALRARAEGLEQELGQARDELTRAQEALQNAQQTTPWERIEQLERDLTAAQQALRDIRAQMATTERPPPRPNATAAIVAAMVTFVLVGAATAAFFLVRRPSTVIVEAPVPPRPRPAPPALEVQTGAVPAPTPPPPLHRLFPARWTGSVASAAGAALKQADACTVEATVMSAGEELSVNAVEVRCGDQTLYRSSDELNGISMTSSAVTAETTPSSDGTAYTLRYDDMGDRTGARSQISLSTADRQARIWRTTVPAFDVRLKLDRLSSTAAGPIERPAETGYLTLVCSPQCDDVLDNGRSLGPSPIVHVEATPGQHRITLVRGDQKKVITTVVVAGQVTAQRVSMK